jgi:hypothetical protein
MDDVSGDQPAAPARLAHDSLCAALTLDEAKAQVKRSGLPLEVSQGERQRANVWSKT